MSKTLIKNALLYDTESHAFYPRNLLVDNDRIVSLDADLVAGDNVVDAAGAFLTPGLIDLHCHIFNHPEQPSRLPADRIGVGQGVTCLLDTGSAGGDTLDEFRQIVVETQATHTFALCNIGSPGRPGLQSGHAALPELVSIDKTVRAIERNRDFALGVKVLASSSHTGLMGLEAVKMARKAADITGTPLMAHIGNAPPVIDDVLDQLRPGDIVTHAYHGKAGGVLGYGKRIIPAFRAAVERGVHVDIAHGRSSFSFRTCEAALEQGMPVHSISSDLHRGNVDRYAVSLARTMTKLRMLGMPFIDVIRAVTVRPAEAVGLDARGFGRIEVGAPAHLTLFDEQVEPMTLEDSEGDKRTAHSWFDTKGVVLDGIYHERSQPL